MTAGETNLDNESINRAFSSDIIENTMNSLKDKQPYPAQNLCKNHCNITYSYVRTVALDPWNKCGDVGYTHKFRFDKEVVYTKKVLSYTVYNFLVDIGGSMGLWLVKHYK